MVVVTIEDNLRSMKQLNSGVISQNWETKKLQLETGRKIDHKLKIVVLSSQAEMEWKQEKRY